MRPLTDLRPLEAAAIDGADRTYYLSPAEEAPEPQLIDSIRTFGILHPPLVQERKSGKYIILAGWKRLAAAVSILKWPVVPCLVVARDCPRLTLHALIIAQSLATRPLSLAEQSNLFANLCHDCSGEDLLPLLAQLGHKPNRQQLAELLSLRDLGEPSLLALHRQTLNLATARKLRNLAKEDREMLLELMARFQFNAAKQQKLAELATMLLRRTDRRMKEIVQPFLQQIKNPRQNNAPQQAAALLLWLHSQCYPRSVQAEKEFSRRLAQLDLPGNIQVDHAPSFEEDTVTLSLKFQDWRSLQQALPAIRLLVADKGG